MREQPPLLSELFRMVVKIIVGGIVIFALVSCSVGVLAGMGASSGQQAKKGEKVAPFYYGDEDSDNAILRVDIVGPIMTHQPEGGGFFSAVGGMTFGYEVKEQLLDAVENDNVKAVMLFVSTPGGTVIGSDAIADGVEAVKASGKPVIAYVDGLSASGGVWSTAPADKIFADNGSLIGSVGVILGNFLHYDDPIALDGGLFMGGVTTRGGIKSTVIAASEGKDIFNPFRPMTEREKTKLVASTKEIYDNFLDHVTSNRPMDRTALIEEHGAMVYSNGLAEEYGYIDGTKDFQETLAYIAGEIGAEGDDWKLVGPEEEQKTPFEQFFGARQDQGRNSSLDPVAAAQAEAANRALMCAELKKGPVALGAQSLIGLCGV